MVELSGGLCRQATEVRIIGDLRSLAVYSTIHFFSYHGMTTQPRVSGFEKKKSAVIGDFSYLVIHGLADINITGYHRRFEKAVFYAGEKVGS